jgi:ketosteroid isomerase-like protein
VSRADVEVVRGVIPGTGDLARLFGASDLRELAALGEFHPEWVAADAEILFMPTWRGMPTGRYHGVEGLLEGWRDWLEPYSSYQFEVEELVDGGEVVVSFVQVRAITARDGVPVEHRPAVVWTVRDGRVARVAFYLDREAAIEDAGLA